MTAAAELIKDGRLEEALAALQARVKSHPTDVEKRFELGELLLALGQWTRADTQFDLVSTQEPSYGVLVALIRQLIRAEIAREEVFKEGRAPELVKALTPDIEAALRLLLDLRDPNVETVELGETPLALGGKVDGRPFSGVRDLDDRLAPVLEVLTSTGKYFWVPWDAVESLALHPPKVLRDLIWRPADLSVSEGPNGVVYIPATYPAAPEEQTPSTRLGRETLWVEDKGVTRGVGLRCFLVGEEDLALSDFTELEFERAQ
jgi:type VI secretion system protein ImpE